MDKKLPPSQRAAWEMVWAKFYKPVFGPITSPGS